YLTNRMREARFAFQDGTNCVQSEWQRERRACAQRSRPKRDGGPAGVCIAGLGGQAIDPRAIPRISYTGHRVDALASHAEEGRGRLRKVTGSRLQALYP